MVSENITANQITVDYIAAQPEKTLTSFAAGDYNQDGVITTVQKKVDSRG